MAVIQQNRWDKLVRRLGGIVSPGSMVADSISELFPMLDVESVKSELQILSGTYLGWGGTARLAAAGEQLVIQLVNPVGSNMIIVPTKVTVGATAGDTTLMSNVGGINAQDLSVTGRRLDNRDGGDNFTVGTIGSFSQVGALGGVGFFRTNTNSEWFLEDPNGLGVLGPGTAWKVGTSNPALFLSVSFFWRERTLQKSEQNLIG